MKGRTVVELAAIGHLCWLAALVLMIAGHPHVSTLLIIAGAGFVALALF